jgi:hypothetical protein
MVQLEAQELKLNQICYHFTCFGITHICYCTYFRTIICPEYTCPGGSIACKYGTITNPCGLTDTTIYKEGTSIVEIIPYLDVNELDELKKGLQVLSQKIDSEYKPAKVKQLDQLESSLNETIKQVQDLKKKTK